MRMAYRGFRITVTPGVLVDNWKTEVQRCRAIRIRDRWCLILWECRSDEPADEIIQRAKARIDEYIQESKR